MTDKVPTKLLWVDLEMTGLNHTKDRIIEVAAIVTDFKLKELATYYSAVQHDEHRLRIMLTGSEFWRSRPEETEEIIRAANGGKAEKVVEQELSSFASKYFLPGEQIYLAGNSIWNDRRFIMQWWPTFAARLHYRMLDVSSFKLWWQGLDKAPYEKQKTHRALDDIRGSIAELQYYQENM